MPMFMCLEEHFSCCSKTLGQRTTPNKSCLSWESQYAHFLPKSGSKYFGYDFGDAMDERYRTVITNSVVLFFLRNKCYVGIVNPVQ